MFDLHGNGTHFIDDSLIEEVYDFLSRDGGPACHVVLKDGREKQTMLEPAQDYVTRLMEYRRV